MFDPTSRYYNLEEGTFTRSDGEEVRYVRRRFCPSGEALPALAEVVVTDGDRLDLLTARSLGDPTQFWRVADANHALNPFDLMEEAGRFVRVPQPTL
jgi:hypothetical protein